MAKHTPGPWIVEFDNGLSSIHDAEGNWIVENNPHRSQADMKLIAAAPELLEAARHSMLHLPTCTRPDCKCAYCRCRAAIAKAEGR